MKGAGREGIWSEDTSCSENHNTEQWTHAFQIDSCSSLGKCFRKGMSKNTEHMRLRELLTLSMLDKDKPCVLCDTTSTDRRKQHIRSFRQLFNHFIKESRGKMLDTVYKYTHTH